MQRRTIFTQAGGGKVRVKPEYLHDVAALLGVQLQACRDAIDRADAIKIPELRTQARGQAAYFRSMEGAVLGILKRLVNRIDKAKLELARLRVEDVLKQLLETVPVKPVPPTFEVPDEPDDTDPGGHPFDSAGNPDGDGVERAGHRQRRKKGTGGSEGVREK